MVQITDLFLGTNPNDKTGTTSRAGGEIINDNFNALNTAKIEQSDIDSQLGNVDNTSDANKPISTAATAKNTAQDNAIAINTAKNSYPSADADKVANLPVDQNSVNTTLQSNIDDKQDELVSGTNIKTVNSQSLLGSGNIEITGGGAVDSVNTQTGDVVLDADDISDATTTNKFVQQEVVTTLGSDNTTIPTSKAVADAITGSGGGDMLSTNNLSDVVSVSDARTNLGLGTLATQNGTFSGTSSGTNTGDQDLSPYATTASLGALATLDTVDTAQIDNDAVTFDKIENIPTNRVLGRSSSGNGDIEALTLPNFRSLIDVYTTGEIDDLLDGKLDNEGYTSLADLIAGENIATTDSTNTFSGVNTFNDDVKFGTDGIYDASTGRYGFGTTSPAKKLEIQGGATSNGGVRIQNGGGHNDLELVGNQGNIYARFFEEGVTDPGRFQLLNSGTTQVDIRTNGNTYFNGGNVGIGTTSPGSKLHVNGGTLTVNSGADNTCAKFESTDPGLNIFINDNTTNSGRLVALNRTGDVLGLNPFGGNVVVGSTSDIGSKFGVVGLPTSSAGLSSGAFWNDGGTVKVV